MTAQSKPWTTADEIDFLRTAGTGTYCREFCSRDRLRLLSGYVAAAGRRRNWGGINPDAAIAEARRLAAAEAQRAGKELP